MTLTTSDNEVLFALDSSYEEIENLIKRKNDRIGELEAINADHQETVAVLTQACNELEGDKAMLIRNVTKLQSERREAETQRYCVHGVPVTDGHWMHRTVKQP